MQKWTMVYLWHKNITIHVYWPIYVIEGLSSCLRNKYSILLCCGVFSFNGVFCYPLCQWLVQVVLPCPIDNPVLVLPLIPEHYWFLLPSVVNLPLYQPLVLEGSLSLNSSLVYFNCSPPVYYTIGLSLVNPTLCSSPKVSPVGYRSVPSPEISPV